VVCQFHEDDFDSFKSDENIFLELINKLNFDEDEEFNLEDEIPEKADEELLDGKRLFELPLDS
jgi:hypothetical protein